MHSVSAKPQMPTDATLAELRKLMAGCKACELWRNATQTVFGEGAENPEVALLQEDGPPAASDLPAQGVHSLADRG
ncbi:MAG: hypothetical protein ACLQU2_11085 [Candidatus Binataceae bacterium]